VGSTLRLQQKKEPVVNFDNIQEVIIITIISNENTRGDS
jgi:hypothetical protein